MEGPRRHLGPSMALLGLAGAFLITALACGGTAAPALQEPSTAEPAVEEPVAVEIGSVPARDPLQYVSMGVGHCTDEEYAWVGCTLDSGKVVSICGPGDASSLAYRFGALGQVELELTGKPVGATYGEPAADGRPWVHFREPRHFMVTEVTFFNDDARYVFGSWFDLRSLEDAKSAEHSMFTRFEVYVGDERVGEQACAEVLTNSATSLHGVLVPD